MTSSIQAENLENTRAARMSSVPKRFGFLVLVFVGAIVHGISTTRLVDKDRIAVKTGEILWQSSQTILWQSPGNRTVLWQSPEHLPVQTHHMATRVHIKNQTVLWQSPQHLSVQTQHSMMRVNIKGILLWRRCYFPLEETHPWHPY